MKNFYVGIDLGGTGVKIAVVDEKGTIIEHSGFPSSSPCDPKKIAQQISHHVKKLKHYSRTKGIGIGAAGDIDQKTGVVRFSPNLGWKNVMFRDMLAKSLKKRIRIDNDANVAALGAYWLESKGKARNMLCVTLGTGVGGGLICDGKLYIGATGSAGEIGHVTINPHGPKCNCGSHGCIERYIGAPRLSEQGREAVIKGKSRIIKKLVNGDLNKITPEILEQAAILGDRHAKKIWETAGERLGIVLASVINLLNPEMIVLAGGVSRAGDLLIKPLKKAILARAYETPAKACRIVISKYTQKLGVVGAALMAK
ncbi:MAG: ROK family protein [Elusimicrobiota bacterium]